jgi:dihydrofolate synthase/folylpolyglutamate synthase
MMHDAEQFLEYLQTSGIKLGLENTARLLAALDNPHRDLRIVHVAGTNGKGSVCAMIAAALTQAGYRTGLFSSPHLVSVRERFQIDGCVIATDTFTSLICELRTRAAALFDETSHSPTYFEFITALAFEYFRQSAVDFAVIEVGMGGRLDSTNLVTPIVSVITTIAHDHTGALGDSIAAIAGEKAGIIKPHVPIVCGETAATAVEVIKAVAAAKQAPIYRRGHDFDVANVVLPAAAGDGPLPPQSCQVTWRDHSVQLEMRLPGRHQAENAATAFATLQVLRQQGIKLSADAVTAGIGGAKWPGRFDQRPGGIIIDVAHKSGGTDAVAATSGAVVSRRPLAGAVFGDAGQTVAGDAGGSGAVSVRSDSCAACLRTGGTTGSNSHTSACDTSRVGSYNCRECARWRGPLAPAWRRAGSRLCLSGRRGPTARNWTKTDHTRG